MKGKKAFIGLFVVLTITASIVLAGCSGSDDGSNSSSTSRYTAFTFLFPDMSTFNYYFPNSGLAQGGYKILSGSLSELRPKVMIASTDSYGLYLESLEHYLSFDEINELINYFISIGVITSSEGNNAINFLKSNGYGVAAKHFTQTIQQPGAYINPGNVVVIGIWKE